MKRAVLALLAALALAGCGAGDANDVLGESAGKLGEIESGDLDLRLIVTPHDGEDGGEFGFEVHGPFAFPERGGLPVMDAEYVQVVDGKRASVRLVSTGTEAFAVVGDEVTELTDEQEAQLRIAGRSLGSGAGSVLSFPLDDWARDAEVSDGGEVGGAETDRIAGELDVVAAVNGLGDLARAAGRALPKVEGEEAERLEAATREATFEAWVGKDDRLLRRLLLKADFGLDVPAGLRAALGDLVGAAVELELAVTDPNSDVKVERPAGG
jgi:hypothetical protein